ncbi:hypothetical protein CVT25_001039 [Psilocybe cyanescens]|uniref:Uncharacterized protein n=1 Tax=Psilocybe cyanescens TaxID=93625 RepID=A0A409X8H7_PSICY|nr:hypothetical protein CVT25_001039 [Psilocybe cyanescens]
MSVFPYLKIQSVLMATIKNKTMLLPVSFPTKKQNDSGAGGKFIDLNYAQKLGLETQPLEKVIQVYNVDETPNKKGTIFSFINLDLKIGN